MITSDNFEFLDFWFYEVGVNMRPVDTRSKSVSQAWKVDQDRAITVEEFEQMKKEGAFSRGAAVVTGKVWRGPNIGYFLNGIDADNRKAIDEILAKSKEAQIATTLEELSNYTLVEQHLDDLARAHIYVYSRRPFKNKASDSGKAWFNKEAMPAIEVKGSKTLMFCTPSMHFGGHRYQFLNQRIPALSDDLEITINNILEKYDISYLDKDDQRLKDAQKKYGERIMIVNEGSRHTELLREMNAKLHEFIRTKPIETIREMCIKFNNLYCRPPLQAQEFDRMWNDAVIHVTLQEREKEKDEDSTGNTSASSSSLLLSTATRTDLISVAQAVRRSSGRVAVNGMIVGISSVVQVITKTTFQCSKCGYTPPEGPTKHNPPLFSFNDRPVKCDSCKLTSAYGPKEHEQRAAMIIQLQNEEKQNDLENLNVVLFEDDTIEVRNGEKAMVIGELYVVQQGRANSKRITYLFANKEKGGAIEYEIPQNEKDDIVMTDEDLVKLNELAIRL